MLRDKSLTNQICSLHEIAILPIIYFVSITFCRPANIFVIINIIAVQQISEAIQLLLPIQYFHRFHYGVHSLKCFYFFFSSLANVIFLLWARLTRNTNSWTIIDRDFWKEHLDHEVSFSVYIIRSS